MLVERFQCGPSQVLGLPKLILSYLFMWIGNSSLPLLTFHVQPIMVMGRNSAGRVFPCGMSHRLWVNRLHRRQFWLDAMRFFSLFLYYANIFGGKTILLTHTTEILVIDSHRSEEGKWTSLCDILALGSLREVIPFCKQKARGSSLSAGDSRLFTLYLLSGVTERGKGLNSKNGTESNSLWRKSRVWKTPKEQ